MAGKTAINMGANMAGSLWTAALSIVLMPVYSNLMGMESFGLVGFFFTLLSVFLILDLGISATLTRELARLAALPGEAQQMRNLTRTLETLYWISALIIASTVMALSGWLATHWIKPVKLSVGEIQEAIWMMGLALFFRWPVGLFTGGLLGLQRQVRLNLINSAFATLQSVGAVLVLWLIRPDIRVFFLWQMGVLSVQALVLHFALWTALPGAAAPARFQPGLLLGIWRFAGGITILAVQAMVQYQFDKVVLSALVSLELFGYYTLVSQVTMGLWKLVTPISQTVYPRFTELMTLRQDAALSSLYHRSAQLVSVLIWAPTAVMLFFASDFLLAWTHKPATVTHTRDVFCLLLLGTAFNCMVHLPGILQGAAGWLSMAIRSNFVLLFGIYLPAGIWLTRTHGILGMATAWLGINALYALLIPALTHRRLLRGEGLRWYGRDFLRPALAALGTAAALAFWHARWASHLPPLLMLAAAGAVVLIVTLLCANELLAYGREGWRNRRAAA